MQWMPCPDIEEMMIKSYTELITLKSYEERLNYLLLLDNNVLSPRHMSNRFYKSYLWRQIRQEVIRRDLGFDLGVWNVGIYDITIVHHINPITEDDILSNSNKLYDLDNLITTSIKTHNIIHYGFQNEISYHERKEGDTVPWKMF